MTLLNMLFHAKWVLTVTSRSFKLSTGTFVMCARWLASKSGEPAGISLRIRTSSTWSRGSSLSRSLRCSDVSLGTFSSVGVDGDELDLEPGRGREPMIGEELAADVCSAWTSAMASRIRRTERTTLRRITALQEARSARKAYVLQMRIWHHHSHDSSYLLRMQQLEVCDRKDEETLAGCWATET